MLYHIICDLIPFNVIVWYNSYFHMLYHIFHNVIPLFLTVYEYIYIYGEAEYISDSGSESESKYEIFTRIFFCEIK